MHAAMSATRARAQLFTAMFIVALIGSAGAQGGAKDPKSPKIDKRAAAVPIAAMQLTWPLPPEQPRVRYVATYRGLDDFKPAKKPSRFMTALLGDADAANRPSDVMLKPYGIAVAPDGRVYVTDTAARRVFVFDLDKRTVAFVGESNGPGRLSKPIGVAVDDEGTVFIADSTLKRVFGYRPDGRVAVAIGHEGELQSPSGMAVDRGGHHLYVADAARHQILSYSTTDGTLTRTIPSWPHT